MKVTNVVTQNINRKTLLKTNFQQSFKGLLFESSSSDHDSCFMVDSLYNSYTYHRFKDDKLEDTLKLETELKSGDSDPDFNGVNWTNQIKTSFSEKEPLPFTKEDYLKYIQTKQLLEQIKEIGLAPKQFKLIASEVAMIESNNTNADSMKVI